MRFIKIINYKKTTLLIMIMFLYVIFNLFDGERGLISYFEKKNIKENLIIKQKLLSIQLASIEKKNKLLTENLDLDYLEILFREKFTVGKSNEKVFIVK